VTDETVPSGQVTMHHVQRLQVLHARCYLSRHVDQTAVTTADRKTVGKFNIKLRSSTKTKCCVAVAALVNYTEISSEH